MPRMRRSARARRQRPQLDKSIYEWLLVDQYPDESRLSLSTKWAIFVLEAVPVNKWKCSQRDRVRLFWDAVFEKVQRGEIEVVTDVEHSVRDAPLVTEEEALNLMESL